MSFYKHYYRTNINIKMVKLTIESIEYMISLMIGLIGFILVGLYNIGKYIYNMIYYKRHGFTYLQLYKEILNLSPRGFEIFCCELLKANGYKAKLTPPTNDYGRDIIAWIDNEKTFIECKHYNPNGKQIGREICQKLIGSCASDLQVTKAVVMTTGTIHSTAIEYAKKIPYLQLWDMGDIMKLCHKVPNKIPCVLSKCNILTPEGIYNKLERTYTELHHHNNKIEYKLKTME